MALVAALPLLGRLSEASEGPNLLAGLWRPLLVLGFLNAALPYLVISWGTQFLPSGTAAILNSTVPLFTAMLAGALPWFADERLGPLGVTGILLGIVGVGMLVGGSFGLFGQGAVMGAAGVLAGSASYAVGGLYARRKMKGVPVRVSAVGQNAAGLLVALPLAALALPREFPSLPAILSLVGLGAVGPASPCSSISGSSPTSGLRAPRRSLISSPSGRSSTAPFCWGRRSPPMPSWG